ncbi:hypothetical protein ACI8AC_08210 [Geodermatophilus sp. SYSU D00758]
MSALALVVLAGLPVPAGVSGLVFVAFWLAGPGAAIAVHLRLRASTKVSQAPVLGLALLIGLSLVGAWSEAWAPWLSAVLVAVATVALAAVPLLRHPSRGWSRAYGSGVRTSSLIGAVVLVASLILWLLSLPGIRTAEPSVFGLLATAPPQFLVSLVGVLAVGLAALRWNRPVLAGGAVAALIVVLRTTASAGVEAPGPTWAYKHIGVVDQLLTDHHVLPGPDIYMNWPGMFSAAAYFSDMSGVGVLALAQWITPLIHLVLALQVVALARVFGAGHTGAAGAALLVVLLNWVGQDYFAPQAIALCLAAGVLVTLAQSRTSPTAALLAILVFGALVPTHQLTPFWVLGLAIVVAVFRRAPFWLPLIMLAVLVAYVLPRLEVVEAYGLFSGFDPVGNATNNVPGVSALGSDVGSLVARATVVVMWLSTLAVLAVRLHRGGWRRAWRNTDVLVPAAFAFSPIALLGGQNYGGEAINRVILYSCLGCAVVLGPALVSLLQRRVLPYAAAVLWTAVIAGLAAQASFNQWFMNVVRSEDISAARFLAEEHPDANVIPVVFTWPGRAWLDYERYFLAEPDKDGTLDGIVSDAVLAEGTIQPNGFDISVDQLEDLVWTRPEDPAYVVFSASMRARDAYYSTYEEGTYEDLLDGLSTDPDWRLVRQSGDLYVFQFVAPGFPVQ